MRYTSMIALLLLVNGAAMAAEPKSGAAPTSDGKAAAPAIHTNTNNPWGVSTIRVGRPTDKLAENKRFYAEGLGFPVIQGFEGHDGFSGVILGAGAALGLQPEALNIEFTTEEKGSPGKSMYEETNFVLYIPDHKKIEQIADRLLKMGYFAQRSHNPWWDNYCGLNYRDPDGYSVILFPKASDLDPAEYNNYLKGDVCPTSWKKYMAKEASR